MDRDPAHLQSLKQMSLTSKRALLEQLLRQKAGASKTFPLSFSQQRLWFLNQLEPGSPLYNVTRILSLSGPLQRTALEQSLNELIQRHEVLRTRFAVNEGSPTQVIDPVLSLPLLVEDLGALSEDEREQEIQRLAREEARRPFDLAQESLIRARLLSLSAAEHVLLLNFHHIITDGWSLGLFFRELETLYAAFCAGQSSPLPDLPLQYADYTLWQRDWLTSSLQKEQCSYWRQHLGGVPVLLELPTDRPRPAAQSFKGDWEPLSLSPQLTAQIKHMSAREGITLFMILLAAFLILLARYSGQEDIVVGTFVANRTRTEWEGLMGFFANTLALRTNLTGDPSFLELLHQVRDVALRAYAHQDLPFERLVEELQPDRTLSSHPLFQVAFSLQNVPQEPLDLAGLTVHLSPVHSGTAKLDLDLSLWEEANRLGGVVEYSTDLFDASTIRRMLSHYELLLKQVVEHPGQRISAVSLLTVAEERSFRAWHAPRADYPQDVSVQSLFEAQVERTPDTIAVVFAEEQLTYREVNRRANQLAHYLQSVGIQSGDLVAVCFERTSDLAIGLLAIGKAGGAYVPLDPTYPQERLHLMIDEAQTACLLTHSTFAARFLSYQKTLICIDRDWLKIGQSSAEAPEITPTPDSLVYVISTSGSTGKPRAAGVPQRGFLNLLHWFVAEFHLRRSDRALVISSASFDLTQKNIFAPLLVGGNVHLFPSGLFDATAIVRTVQERDITLLNCTPGAFYSLLDCLGEDKWDMLSSLRFVFLGGETIAAQRLFPWLSSKKCNAQVVNTYGPTECSDTVAFHRLDPAERIGSTPLGKPVANTELYILDTHLQLVPPGIAGELYIGGDSVGSGYMNDPAFTASKFLPDPYSSWSGGRRMGNRLYKTGDRVRWLGDGTLAFLGRVDRQVKLRGYRIELEEIEMVLRQHALVEEAVVVMHGNTSDEQRLVGYIVPARDNILAGQLPTINLPNEKASQEEIYANNPRQEHLTQQLFPILNQHLKDQLPGYMLPSALVLLPALPLLPNGKVDRQALPEPLHAVPERDDFAAPQNPVEQHLALIWAAVLGVAHVSVSDNFFERGGHSLMATRVIARVEKALNIEVPLRLLFEKPTLAEFAESVYHIQHRGLEGLLAKLDALSEEEVEKLLREDGLSGRS